MTATLMPDDEFFDDLDALVAEQITKQTDRATLAAKQKRLAAISSRKSGEAELERHALIAAIRKLEEAVIWTTIGCVGLFDSQDCRTCGATHTVFIGWMTLQKHKTDATATRLLAGKPIEALPVTRNEHWRKVDVCINCWRDHA